MKWLVSLQERIKRKVGYVQRYPKFGMVKFLENISIRLFEPMKITQQTILQAFLVNLVKNKNFTETSEKIAEEALCYPSTWIATEQFSGASCLLKNW